MHRFQNFLVFWKAESQLFHLKTSRFKRELVFLSKKQHLRNISKKFTKMPSCKLVDPPSKTNISIWNNAYLKNYIRESKTTPLSLFQFKSSANPSILSVHWHIHTLLPYILGLDSVTVGRPGTGWRIFFQQYHSLSAWITTKLMI